MLRLLRIKPAWLTSIMCGFTGIDTVVSNLNEKADKYINKHERR